MQRQLFIVFSLVLRCSKQHANRALIDRFYSAAFTEFLPKKEPMLTFKPYLLIISVN